MMGLNYGGGGGRPPVGRVVNWEIPGKRKLPGMALGKRSLAERAVVKVKTAHIVGGMG